MKKRTRITVVLLIVAVIGAIGWLVVRWNAAGRTGIVVTTTGPLDIRLWGIRPDAGDTIYDPNGKAIQETLGIARWDSPHWGEKSQRFDFIFELPDSNEPPQFSAFPRIGPSGENRHLGGGFDQQLFDYEGRTLLWLRATFPRTFKRWVLGGVWRSEAAFDAVDLTLNYYHGPPGKSIFTLKGPFEPNSTVSSEDSVYKVSFKEDVGSGSSAYAEFELSTSVSFGLNTPVVAYDASGNHNLAKTGSGRSSPQGSRIEYRAHGIPLKRIAAIAFGEQPRHITFNNVNLNVAGHKRRAHAAYLDQMAERLGLTVTSKNSGVPRFKSAAEALKVIDIVRGSGLLRAAEAIVYRRTRGERIDLNNLADEQAVRLRETLNRWLTAIDPEFRAWSVRIGLLCKWPEFVEPALELLERPVRRDYRSMPDAQMMVADALRHCAGGLSDDHVGRIADLLLGNGPRETLLRLMKLLRDPKTESRVEALWKLAKDDRPWVWWYAVERLAQWGEFADKQDSLPQKLKLRLFLIRGAAGFSNVEQTAGEAYKLAGELLAPQLHALDPGIFRDVLGSLIKNVDRQQVTTAMIGFLRRVEEGDRSVEYAIDEIVRYINAWYGLDIGGLGSDVDRQTPERNKYDWAAIVAETVEWYGSIQDANDANSGSP